MPHCLDAGTVKDVEVEECDGRNWEKYIADNPEIQQRSKKKNWIIICSIQYLTKIGLQLLFLLENISIS